MTIGIVGNRSKPDLPPTVVRIARVLRDSGVRFVADTGLGSVLRVPFRDAGLGRPPLAGPARLRRSDMILSLGGDGTMLQTARLVAGREIPILGVNLGKLGFLAEVPIEEVEACLSEVLKGRYRTESRSMIMAEGKGLRKPYTALNDIVLDLTESSRVMHVETWVDGKFLATFTGDGMIVSTPTGSTAYALSNGGPILPPLTRAMMVSPICPHTLTARPVVLPETSVVTLRVSAAPARLHLTADGQPTVFLRPPVEITVRKAPFVTRLVKRRGSSYFDVLRSKLQWGRDVRTDPQ